MLCVSRRRRPGYRDKVLLRTGGTSEQVFVVLDRLPFISIVSWYQRCRCKEFFASQEFFIDRLLYAFSIPGGF